MSNEQNTRNAEIVTEAFRAIEANNMAGFGSHMTDDVIFSGPFPEPLNKEATLWAHQQLVNAMPDWKFNEAPFETLADGRISTSVQITGTHTGTLVTPIPVMPPIPPTGRHVHLSREPIMFTISEGRISRIDVDPVAGGGLMGILHQIGVELPQQS